MSKLEDLVAASDVELLSLVGLYSVTTLDSPQDVLKGARGGLLWASPPSILGDVPFEHSQLARQGRRFFALWATQIRKAICENAEVGVELRKQGLSRLDVSVGIVTGALTTHVPSLAPYSGLLSVVGVFVVRSGIGAFCAQLSEFEQEQKSQPSDPSENRR